MTFEEIVDQAIDMIRRRGQVSYRMLKRHFDLADDALEDIKEELLFAHPVVDEDGRGVVWTGQTTIRPGSTDVSPASQEADPTGEPPQVVFPTEEHVPEAERRQLTVMFVDLVGSTRLSGKLDPEDLRDMVRAYQDTCTSVITRYDGHVAQLLGDGLLVYFRFPQAHEDDAQRAIHTGLGIIEAIQTINTHLEQDQGVKLAEDKPVMFIVEDLHWTDPSTLELLDLLIDQTPTASIYTLLTCRPEFPGRWANRSYLTQVTLNRLSRDHIEQMVASVTGDKPLPTEVIEQLVDKTDGVPLYIEEMTKAVLESGRLKEIDGRYILEGTSVSLEIPATLQDSLMARLDRLTTAKAVAQYASVVGRQFSYDLLQAVSQLDEATLQSELGRLVEAELIYHRGVPPQATYLFKHALIQDTAYESLLRSTRQGYHRRIAEVLEAGFPEVAAAQPELLAHHYMEAGLKEQAVQYWQKAGGSAVHRSANVEAIAHLKQGLTTLATLPATPARLQQELDFQVALGVALRVTKGHAAPEVERAYDRARELCEQVGDTLQLFPVLRGLIVYAQNRGDLQEAHRFGEQILHLAALHPTIEHRMLTHYQIGQILSHRGDPAAASRHRTQALSMYSPQEHRPLIVRYGNDFEVGAHGFLSWELWQLGYADQAMWGAYTRHLDPEQHTTSKRYTQKIEHNPLMLRTRIKRLVRKTICFSKSTQMHDLVTGLLVNRYAFGRAV